MSNVSEAPITRAFETYLTPILSATPTPPPYATNANTPPYKAASAKSPFTIPFTTWVHSLTIGHVFKPVPKFEDAYFLIMSILLVMLFCINLGTLILSVFLTAFIIMLIF